MAAHHIDKTVAPISTVTNKKHENNNNNYAGPPYSRTKIYAALMSRSSSSLYYIERYLLWSRVGAQQQTRRPSLLLLIDGTDRQTDTRPFYDACCIRCGLRNNNNERGCVRNHFTASVLSGRLPYLGL